MICGRLENIEIRVTDDVSKPTHRVLEITSVDGCDFIRPTMRLVCCASTASAYIGAGQNYILPAGMFHVSRPGASGPTVTVLLAEDRHESPELALGRLGGLVCSEAKERASKENGRGGGLVKSRRKP